MPGVAGKSGRKKRDVQTYTVNELLSATAVKAAQYLKDVMFRKATANWKLLRVAEFSIDHEIGKAKIKTEITGADGKALTLAQLILMVSGEEAAQFIKTVGSTTEIPKQAESLNEEAEDKEE